MSLLDVLDDGASCRCNALVELVYQELMDGTDLLCGEVCVVIDVLD